MKRCCRTVTLALVALFCPAVALADASPSLETMAGAMLMVGFRGTSLPADSPLLAAIARGEVGGVILFDYDVPTKNSVRNVTDTAQLARLTRTLHKVVPAGRQLLVAVDQEGGKVRRLKPRHGFMDLPSPKVMGGMDVQDILDIGTRLGHELATVGINMDLAPGVDVDINPHSPAIGALQRSFSTSAARTAACAEAFSTGLARSRVLAVLKHFPGHGSASRDSHTGFTESPLPGAKSRNCYPTKNCFRLDLAGLCWWPMYSTET